VAGVIALALAGHALAFERAKPPGPKDDPRWANGGGHAVCVDHGKEVPEKVCEDADRLQGMGWDKDGRGTFLPDRTRTGRP
jgi:hypothetical protein